MNIDDENLVRIDMSNPPPRSLRSHAHGQAQSQRNRTPSGGHGRGPRSDAPTLYGKEAALPKGRVKALNQAQKIGAYLRLIAHASTTEAVAIFQCGRENHVTALNQYARLDHDRLRLHPLRCPIMV